jgi:hypothetical protein
VIIFLLLLLFPTTLFPKEHSSIHAILAYDTILDLQSPVQKDVKHISTFLKKLVKATKMKLSVQTIKGSELRLDKVQSSLPKNHHDVLLFYYSGHGYQGQATIWPSLYFSSKKETLPAETIRALLESFHPRLAILLFDCCNNTYLFPRSPLQPKQVSIPLSLRGPGLAPLFLNAKGTVMATGAQPGFASYAGKDGSLFTLAFLGAIKNLASERASSWEKVFDQMALLCQPYQRPLSFIQILE